MSRWNVVYRMGGGGIKLYTYIEKNRKVMETPNKTIFRTLKAVKFVIR